MLDFDILTGKLDDADLSMAFADSPYHYSITGWLQAGAMISEDELTLKNTQSTSGEALVRGEFQGLGIEVKHHLIRTDIGVEETLVIKNLGVVPVFIENFEAGFCADLGNRPDWRLNAIPFRVQLDGSLHDYSTQALIDGKFSNAVFVDTTRKFMPPLTEQGALRSEAWAWGWGDQGCVIIKYNNEEIELSVARPMTSGTQHWLRFGGAGFCLYAEPSGAHLLEPGEEFTFGVTTYIPFQGGLSGAFNLYREFLDRHGHTFPVNYNPPVNWNELYDVGWHHSKTEELNRFYTREALLGEAEKAKEIGCELLYLDPGWEICEGTTLWDESRLGGVKSLVDTLREDYGLDLGYRTILRTYKELWPTEYLVRHHGGAYEPIEFGDQYFWEACACNPTFWKEKLERILTISRNGIRFMMVDEFDWRGPCHDMTHGHPIPTKPLDHIQAVYRLCSEIRKACPDLTIEAHDPVWPWSNSIYVPTYFQQGFGIMGSYDENWGFEYMWDCLNDLKSGRALALYYYNLGCNIPLYLHITMAADNDECVFFWWVASTVRHMGIGGKLSSKTIEPPQGLPVHDPESRFLTYKKQMGLYRKLKTYFTRGNFYGIAENAHLHTLSEKKGGVLNLFNLTEAEQNLEFFVPAQQLNAENPLPVEGATAIWSDTGVRIQLKLKAMSPAIICIGDAISALL